MGQVPSQLSGGKQFLPHGFCGAGLQPRVEAPAPGVQAASRRLTPAAPRHQPLPRAAG